MVLYHTEYLKGAVEQLPIYLSSSFGATDTVQRAGPSEISKNPALSPNLLRESNRRKWKLTSIHQFRDALATENERKMMATTTKPPLECEVLRTPELRGKC